MFTLPRRRFLQVTVGAGSSGLLSILTRATHADDPTPTTQPNFAFKPDEPLIPAPPNPRDWPAFRDQLAKWREQTRRDLKYSDALYRRPEFAWTSRCYCCGFLMLNDQMVCAPQAGQLSPDRYLDQAEREFGGFDAIVLWHAYPQIGIDDRNQFDFYRDQPGGLEGLLKFNRSLHDRGVKAFIDYNPWDTGTRREGKPDIDALAELVAAIDADGLFLDTMKKGGADFRARLDARRPGVEGEDALPLANLHDHHLSWRQGFPDDDQPDGPAPGVLRNKWIEHRHMQHQIKRRNADHANELQSAWMNGSGMLVWENVFGTWVGWNDRDKSLLRAMLPIQRRFAAIFAGDSWTPLVDGAVPPLYASLWESAGVKLWTLINRAREAKNGVLLTLSAPLPAPVYDLVTGRPAEVTQSGGTTQIHGQIAAHGVACLLTGTKEALGHDFDKFLEHQAANNLRSSSNSAPPEIAARLRTVEKIKPPPTVPADMAEIPAAEFTLETLFRIRECGFYESTISTDYLAKLHQPATFRREVKLPRFAIDLAPVTNAQFADFLKSSAYRPTHADNFLKHWRDHRPPAGHEEHPVVYVDLDDARAYAKWAGKRLPTEEEWQYAAQGPKALKYPWGNEMVHARCNHGQTGGTTPVKNFPDGRSPFGCWDCCGNVWEWTESERADEHTRFCILKGGSFYQAKGSGWYFDGGPRPNNFAAKFLLSWPGLDRCATIGFRCASDL